MWSKFEPVRSYVYSVLAVLLGLLVAKGIVDNSQLDLWLALAGAVLGVPGVELARKRVQPVVKQNRTAWGAGSDELPSAGPQ